MLVIPEGIIPREMTHGQKFWLCDESMKEKILSKETLVFLLKLDHIPVCPYWVTPLIGLMNQAF